MWVIHFQQGVDPESIHFPQWNQTHSHSDPLSPNVLLNTWVRVLAENTVCSLFEQNPVNWHAQLILVGGIEYLCEDEIMEMNNAVWGMWLWKDFKWEIHINELHLASNLKILALKDLPWPSSNPRTWFVCTRASLYIASLRAWTASHSE